MNGRTLYLLLALAGAGVLYLLSRTDRGAVVAADVVGAVVNATTPRGIRNNNPGNIDWIADPAHRWNGMVGSDGRFGVFDTAANGIRAIGKELKLDATRGVDTVAGLISNWAPAGENNTVAYIAAVSRALGLDTAGQQRIDVRARLGELVAAIIQHENGQQPYKRSDIERWANLA